MEFIKKHSSASVVLRVMLRSSSTGQGLTGLTSASSGLIISTIADTEASPTNYTVAAGNVESITTLGTYAAPTASKCRFKEVDATNHPGLYELQLADARWAVSNAKALRVSLSGAASLLGKQVCYQLVAFDPDAVAGLGLTNLDAAITSRLAPTVAARTLDVSAGGEAGIDLANVGSPTTAVNLSGVTIKTATDVETDTQDIQGRIPAALVSGRMDSNVQAMADDVITAAKIAADAIGASELATSAVTEIQSGLSTLDAAAVRAALGLAAANLDTQLGLIYGVIDTEIAAIKAKTDTLPASPANEATLTTMSATLALIAGYIDTEVAAIKAKTDNLPSDPADASDIAASFASLSATLTTIAGYIDTEVAAILAAVDTEVGAIKAKTDNLPADPADASDIAASFATVNTKLDAIDDFVDSEVAAIKTVTDHLGTTLELDGSVYRFTTNALEQAPAGGGGGPTAEAIADEIELPGRKLDLLTKSVGGQ